MTEKTINEILDFLKKSQISGHIEFHKHPIDLKYIIRVVVYIAGQEYIIHQEFTHKQAAKPEYWEMFRDYVLGALENLKHAKLKSKNDIESQKIDNQSM